MGRRFVAALLVGVIFGCTNPDETLQPVTFESAGVDGQLAALGRSLGDSRIVLLGENGHGVGEFTEAKVELIEWLHAEHAS